MDHERRTSDPADESALNLYDTTEEGNAEHQQHLSTTDGFQGLLPGLRQIPPVVFLIILMVLLELEESIQAAPTVRLIESAICQKHYSSVESGLPVDESRCKDDIIQRRLAFVRGWQGLFDAIPTLLLSVAFGHLADKYSRRLVMFLTEAGMILSLGWILLTCYSWAVMPIQVLWISALFRFLGGGPNVAFAMIMTMAADISSDDTRSKTFYTIFSSLLFTELVGPPISFVTMNKALWLPYVICVISLASTFPVLLYMPEFRQDKKDIRDRPNSASQGSPVRKPTVFAIVKEFFCDVRVVLGLVSVFTAQFRTVTMDILLPYTSKRFGWTLSQTTTLISVVAGVNIVLFLIVLPIAIPKLQAYLDLQTQQVDLHISRISHGLLACGALFLTFSSSIPLLFVSIVIFAAGFGARLSMVSVITSYVPAASTASLYTLISAIEELSRLIGSPLIQAAWSQGITWGGQFMGFPFLVLGIIFSIGAIAALFISWATLGKPGIEAQYSRLLQSDNEEDAQGIDQDAHG